jgi:hypothetical protein
LNKFNPEKLFVQYMDGVSPAGPVIPRRYTLTHSDVTGELFLTIGIRYALYRINAMRDEVLGEWSSNGSIPYVAIYVHIDQGEYTRDMAAKRNEIFRRELPLALTALRYGDRFMFDAYPYLDRAPIIVSFMSSYPQYSARENWGTFHDYSPA